MRSTSFRGTNPESDRGLDWLWETGLPSEPARRTSDGAVYHDLLTRLRRGEAQRLAKMHATPFAPGCSIFTKTSAAIYLAAVFGRGREARVQRAIRCLDDVAETRGGLWCSPSCSANLLRAYASHPDAARGRSFARAVRALGNPRREGPLARHAVRVDVQRARVGGSARGARAGQARDRLRAPDAEPPRRIVGTRCEPGVTTFQIVQGLRSIEA